MARSDLYPNFQALAGQEARENFAIIWHRGASPQVAIIAPHGGKIEPGTSSITREIAAQDYSYYVFEGRKANNNGQLHITSSHFDEPLCLALIEQARIVLGIHGCQGEGAIYVGGLNAPLADALFDALVEAGLPAHRHGHKFPGHSPTNICNRGATGEGAQLEMTPDMRRNPAAERIVAAARGVIESLVGRDKIP